jgi:hypothetical protein
MFSKDGVVLRRWSSLPMAMSPTGHAIGSGHGTRSVQTLNLPTVTCKEAQKFGNLAAAGDSKLGAAAFPRRRVRIKGEAMPHRGSDHGCTVAHFFARYVLPRRIHTSSL